VDGLTPVTAGGGRAVADLAFGGGTRQDDAATCHAARPRRLAATGYEGVAMTRFRFALGLLALTSLPPAVADSCAPIEKAATAYGQAERYTVKMDMLSKGKSFNTEVMIAPEGMYIRAGDQWIRSPVAVNRKDLLNANKSVFSDCKKVGEERVEGVPTAIYRFTGKAESQSPMTGKIWIGTADDLPRRMEGKTQDADITQVIRYDVEAPKGGTAGLPGLDQLKGLFGR
jgi:hypothetical protein